MIRKENTVILNHENALEHGLEMGYSNQNGHPVNNPAEQAHCSRTLEPSLCLELSQNTMQRIIEDTRQNTFGAAMFSAVEPTRATSNTSFFATIDDVQAETNGEAPHCFSIETESLVLPHSNKEGNSVTLSEIASLIKFPSSQDNQIAGMNLLNDKVMVNQDEHISSALPTTVNQGYPSSAPPTQKVETPITSSDGVGSNAGIPQFPSNTPFFGPYNFQVFFSKAPENESKKAISYRFVAEENKLFVRSNVACPVHFKLDNKPPDGTIIRAMAIYSRPQDMQDVVKRCMNHTMQDKGKLDNFEHFIRCSHTNAVYEELASLCGRQSVSFEWQCPPTGSEYLTALYEFMCFSSCVGTINRRPTQLLFSLEHGSDILGRQCVDLKVCACPGRDADPSAGLNRKKAANKQQEAVREEKKTIEQHVSNFTTVEPMSHADRRTINDDQIYTVSVRGRELYKIVMTIVRNYELSRHYEQLVADAQSTAVHDITADTSVVRWLQSLNMEQYAANFQKNRLKTMEDLDGRLTTDYLLGTVGVSAVDADSLQTAYVRWRSIYDATQLSSLESVASVDGKTDNNGDVPLRMDDGGYRVSKTTVRHLYKVPAKKRRIYE